MSKETTNERSHSTTNRNFERNQEMSEIKRYRKKPVVIEAVQWDGTSGGASTVIDWIVGNGGLARYRCVPGGCSGTEEDHCVAIETLEGTMTAGTGDWIIRGVQGEFYPCKNDIFQATYKPEYQRLSAFCGAALHGDCSYYQCDCDCHEGDNQ